jgi:hypothetical protein
MLARRFGDADSDSIHIQVEIMCGVVQNLSITAAPYNKVFEVALKRLVQIPPSLVPDLVHKDPKSWLHKAIFTK